MSFQSEPSGGYRFDVLIPFYEDVPLRRTIWEHNRFLWGEIPEANVCESDDPTRARTGIFSPGRARNAAAAQGHADWIIAYGSDEVPPTREILDDAFKRARKTNWAGLYAATRVVKPAGSEAFSTGMEQNLDDLHLSTRVPTATGLVLVSRELFTKAHGYDTRFTGWGFEDSALRKVLNVLGGTPIYPSSRQDCYSLSPHFLDLISLYRSSIPNRDLYEAEYARLSDPDDLPPLFSRRDAADGNGPARVRPAAEARNH